MQLPDILTDEGRAAIITCLRIAAQMGELIDDAENDTLAETMGTSAADVPERHDSSLPIQRTHITNDEHAPVYRDEGSEI
jgi:hypothetical protein